LDQAGGNRFFMRFANKTDRNNPASIAADTFVMSGVNGNAMLDARH
jgi:hypothetical protein